MCARILVIKDKKSNLNASHRGFTPGPGSPGLAGSVDIYNTEIAAVTCITLFAKRVKLFCIFMLQLGIFDIVKHS